MPHYYRLNKNFVLFEWRELKEEAKQRAMKHRKDYLDRHPDDFSREIQETFKYDLDDYFGLPSEQIHFSLGYSQGDYVSFSGTVDVDAYLKAQGLRDQYALLFFESRTISGEPKLDCLIDVEIKTNSHNDRCMYVVPIAPV